MNAWKIGASSSGNKILDKNFFDCCKKYAIKYVEVAPPFNYQGRDIINEIYKTFDFKKIKKCADDANVKIWSYHLPFDPEGANLVSHDKELRDFSIKTDCEMIKEVSESGIKIFVLHPSVGGYTGDDRIERIKYSQDSVYKINQTAKECGVTIAVENLPRTAISGNVNDLIKVISVDDTLKVCFDVNHLFLESHKDFVNAVGDKIVTVHISDYDFEDEKHWLPGMGKIDWKELISLLQSINYQGPFMNEVNITPGEDIPEGKISFAMLKEANDNILKKYSQK